MAFTSTWRQNETQGFRGLGVLVVCAFIGLLALVPAVMFLWPESPTGRITMVRFGGVDDYEVGKPVQVIPEGLPVVWIVRQDDRTIRAFIGKETRFEPLQGCTVPWRSTFSFNGMQGWFRDPCGGSTYGLDGVCVYGPCVRNMDELPVIVRGNAVFLDIGKAIRGARPGSSETTGGRTSIPLR
jgi:Rieske Fe-S protein